MVAPKKQVNIDYFLDIFVSIDFNKPRCLCL